MIFDILTTFPDMVAGPLSESIVGKAQEREIIIVRMTNIRDFAADKHRSTDDYPYGGGAGMVMKPEPLVAAIDSARDLPPGEGPVILLSPQGETFNQEMAEELARLSRIILVCGHYEGVDERVIELAVDREISVGDYVLTGGELAALIVVDAVARLVPGVLGREESAWQESFTSGLLDYPHYTRPAEFRGTKVPEVLLSGDHGAVDRWRHQMAIERTRQRRPDLYEKWLKTENTPGDGNG